LYEWLLSNLDIQNYFSIEKLELNRNVADFLGLECYLLTSSLTPNMMIKNVVIFLNPYRQMRKDIASNIAKLDFLQMLQNLLLVTILSFDSVTFCRACNTHRVTQKNGNF